MKNNPNNGAQRAYQISGKGGQGACIAAQSVLQEHGLCGHTDWTSPEWRFLFITPLASDDIATLLGDLGHRFGIDVSDHPPALSFGAKLAKTNLSNADLNQARLRTADLHRANLRATDLTKVDLREANLREADLSGAKLIEADLSEADLSQACLRGADLSRANLSKTNLDEAILREANLEGATVSGEQLAKAQTLQDAILPDGTRCREPNPDTVSQSSVRP